MIPETLRTDPEIERELLRSQRVRPGGEHGLGRLSMPAGNGSEDLTP